MRNKGFNPPDTHKEVKRLRFLRSIDERTQISFVKVARTELLKAEARALLPSQAVYDENSSAAPFAEIIVTKNRFGSLGTVYQRFCNGHFVACDQDEARQICTTSNAPAARGRRYAQGADV
ncbi:hypothetical protein D3822_26395 [Escherichia coli]|nr:hypothetical protein D3822_26395 [Escherichia coli]